MKDKSTLAVMAAVLITLTGSAYAMDTAALRDKLNRYYKKQDVELKTEQRRDVYERGELTLEKQRRLTQKLLEQRLEQQRLELRQLKQVPVAGNAGAPGGQDFTPRSRRSDFAKEQRFEREQRQQQLRFKVERKAWQ